MVQPHLRILFNPTNTTSNGPGSVDAVMVAIAATATARKTNMTISPSPVFRGRLGQQLANGARMTSATWSGGTHLWQLLFQAGQCLVAASCREAMENNGLAASSAVAQNRLKLHYYEYRHETSKHNGFGWRLDLVGWLCIANESRGP